MSAEMMFTRQEIGPIAPMVQFYRRRESEIPRTGRQGIKPEDIATVAGGYRCQILNRSGQRVVIAASQRVSISYIGESRPYIAT